MSDEAMYDVESLILQVKQMVETGRSMPMSASVMVNREEMLELLDEAMAILPKEVRHARWLLKERQEFLAQARREADDLIEAGRVRAERMVERTEVVREARRVAQSLVDQAESNSRALRHEAEDYVDQKLAAFEVVLERVMAAVRKGRERLQVVIDPLPEDQPPEESAPEAGGEPEEGFFDQDGR
jgi:cell division septum initiation protein DivIVA